MALCVIHTNAQEKAQQQVFDPLSSYKQVQIEGFTVLINSKVLAHEEDLRRMRVELKKQLKEIKRVVPDKPLQEFYKYRIWVEWEQTKGAAVFHPSKGWLTNNGYNPEKTGSVELSHSRHFVSWSHSGQPCMVLHEMAHAYHHIVLGLKDERVTAAFKNAVDQKLYDPVKHVNGREKKAYALTNKKEYFSELTEAYFGKNDFFPFIISELKEYDPVGYQMMVDCWGVPKAPQR